MLWTSILCCFRNIQKKALKYKAPSNYIIRPLNKVKELDRMQKLMESMIEKNIKNEDNEHLIIYIVTIINSEKDHLDWEESYKDNNIEEIFNKYCN